MSLQRQVAVFQESLDRETYLSFTTLQKRRYAERERQAADKLQIASVQFIALAITFLFMIGYYSYYGFNMYTRRMNFETKVRAGKIHAPNLDDFRDN